MLNNIQIKLIQTAVRKAGIRTNHFDGRYRMLLRQYLQPNGEQVTTCKQLNNAQLDDILAICEAHGWRMPGKPEDYYRNKVNKKYEIASYGQQSAIRYLAADLNISCKLGEFIERQTSGQAKSIAELSPKQAYKVIEGLKAMFRKRTGTKLNNLQQIKDYQNEQEENQKR